MVLAHLLSEARRPAISLWRERLIASRLLQYETVNRVLAYEGGAARLDAAIHVIDSVALVDLSPRALARALAPWPRSVRTLDSLHLATMDFLRGRGQTLRLASYDRRLNDAAQALGFALYEGF